MRDSDSLQQEILKAAPPGLIDLRQCRGGRSDIVAAGESASADINTSASLLSNIGRLIAMRGMLYCNGNGESGVDRTAVEQQFYAMFQQQQQKLAFEQQQKQQSLLYDYQQQLMMNLLNSSNNSKNSNNYGIGLATSPSSSIASSSSVLSSRNQSPTSSSSSLSSASSSAASSDAFGIAASLAAAAAAAAAVPPAIMVSSIGMPSGVVEATAAVSDPNKQLFKHKERKRRRAIGNADNTLDGLVAKRTEMEQPLCEGGSSGTDVSLKRYRTEKEAIELPDDESEMKRMSTDPDVSTRQCSVCGYQGKWVSEMIRHKRVHTSERPFRCKYCNRTSKWKADLIRHVAKTHGIRVVSKYSRSKAFESNNNNGGVNKDESLLFGNNISNNNTNNIFIMEDSNNNNSDNNDGGEMSIKSFDECVMSTVENLAAFQATDPQPSDHQSNINQYGQQQQQRTQTFRCLSCFFEQDSVARLTAHLHSAHNVSPFECVECKRTFDEFHAANRHFANPSSPSSSPSTANAERCFCSPLSIKVNFSSSRSASTLEILTAAAVTTSSSASSSMSMPSAASTTIFSAASDEEENEDATSANRTPAASADKWSIASILTAQPSSSTVIRKAESVATNASPSPPLHESAVSVAVEQQKRDHLAALLSLFYNNNHHTQQQQQEFQDANDNTEEAASASSGLDLSISASAAPAVAAGQRLEILQRLLSGFNPLVNFQPPTA